MNVSNGILEYAEQNGVDLIVIGTVIAWKRCITCCNLRALPGIGGEIIVTRRPIVIVKDNLNGF
jgi:nucleotide-binding universal stress UspA family protein